jgi:hypothetical protein
MTESAEDIATREPHPLDIHTWFSLTYANYLVIPRSVLQSMPEDWQHRFTALLGEMDQAFGHLDWPAYEVRALKREREHTMVIVPCGECCGTGREDARDPTPSTEALRDALRMLACEDPKWVGTLWWNEHVAILGGEPCPECNGEMLVEDPEGSRYETPEEVGFRDDPIPHYNRGRTKLEPREREASSR